MLRRTVPMGCLLLSVLFVASVFLPARSNGQGGFIMPAANATYTTAFASLPVTCRDGDVNFPTNSFYLFRCTSAGNAWAPWGPLYPLTLPSGSFSWDNQGTSTISTTTGSFLLSSPTGSSGLAVRYTTAPAAPYTVTVLLIPSQLVTDTNNQNPQVGVVFRQSSDGKLVIFGPYQATSALTPPAPRNITVSKWTNSTMFSAPYGSPVTFGGSMVSPVWLRIADDNTNRVCSYSGDGVTWVTFHSIGRTDFLTADQVGFATNVGGSAAAVAVRVVSWSIQ